MAFSKWWQKRKAELQAEQTYTISLGHLEDLLLEAHRLNSEQLRDKFAMAALNGLIASSEALDKTYAREAYSLADAMLKERMK